MLHRLTSAQRLHLPRHRQHWQSTALSIAALDPIGTKSRVQALIAASHSERQGVPQQVVVVESPWQALKLRDAWNKPPALQDFGMLLQNYVAQLVGEIEAQIDRRLLEILHIELVAPLQQVVTESLTSPIVAAIAQQQDLIVAIEANQIVINDNAQAIATEQWLPTICLLDYAIDVLSCAVTNSTLR